MTGFSSQGCTRDRGPSRGWIDVMVSERRKHQFDKLNRIRNKGIEMFINEFRILLQKFLQFIYGGRNAWVPFSAISSHFSESVVGQGGMRPTRIQLRSSDLNSRPEMSRPSLAVHIMYPFVTNRLRKVTEIMAEI